MLLVLSQGCRWPGSTSYDLELKEMGWHGLTSRSSGKKWHPLPSTLILQTNLTTLKKLIDCVTRYLYAYVCLMAKGLPR